MWCSLNISYIIPSYYLKSSTSSTKGSSVHPNWQFKFRLRMLEQKVLCVCMIALVQVLYYVYIYISRNGVNMGMNMCLFSGPSFKDHNWPRGKNHHQNDDRGWTTTKVVEGKVNIKWTKNKLELERRAGMNDCWVWKRPGNLLAPLFWVEAQKYAGRHNLLGSGTVLQFLN